VHQTANAARVGAPPARPAARASAAPRREDVHGPADACVRVADAELVRRCRAGERSAWRELVDRYTVYVYAIARRHGLSTDRTEDVVQEVFTRVYTRLGTLQDDGALRPWIAQMTRHAAIDRLRSDTHELPVGSAAPGVAAARDLDRINEAMVVQEALRELPPMLRDTLERFFVHDESYRTIAGALALAPGTVASRISRGLSLLRSALEGDAVATDGRGAGHERRPVSGTCPAPAGGSVLRRPGRPRR
jgi:RNA polymerase sigma-70 factor (ECF subfamily)